MNRTDVEQILIIVRSGKEDALHMKIYKEGTLTRRGCGGLPEIGISAISFTDSDALFNTIMQTVPQEVLDNPVNYEAETIQPPLEYLVAFYGVSKNGETGEHAEWTKSTGIRFLIDANTSFGHPFLSFADTFALDAAEQTNPWYFDVMVYGAYGLKATTLPQTMLAVPQTEAATKSSFQNYVNQIRHSTRKWDIQSFAKDKVYVNSRGNRFEAAFTSDGESMTVKFVSPPEQTGAESLATNGKRKWWKMW